MLSLDLHFCTPEGIGQTGVSRSQLKSDGAKAIEAVNEIERAHRAGTLQFLDLPQHGGLLEPTLSLANALASRFDSAVVLGIGGSSLGAKALYCGLTHPHTGLLTREQRSGARLFFPDNVDPVTLASLLDVIDLERTVFLAVTKSGGTAETWAQLMYVNERLGPQRMQEQVIAVTDPVNGALRSLADQLGWRSLPVPKAVGGRFSVFSPVGILPAALAGIDVKSLLSGAAQMATRCRTLDWDENPAAQLATALHCHDCQRSRSTHVFMPYLDALRETADWYLQLWGESLGKSQKGPTPLRAVGATDQHSLLQLLMQGPDDKVTVFAAARHSLRDLTIPKSFESESEVSYLGEHSMHRLLSVEQQSTAAALASVGRPSIGLEFERLTPSTLGELLMLWQATTAIAGHLYGVNAFDQPGVERTKQFTGGALGRPGYGEAATELRTLLERRKTGA